LLLVAEKFLAAGHRLKKREEKNRRGKIRGVALAPPTRARATKKETPLIYFLLTLIEKLVIIVVSRL